MIVLPDQAEEKGVEPAELEVALAVRMSASLPLLFRPIRFGAVGAASLVVDGGLLPGIPFSLFRSGRGPGHPTLAIQAGPGAARRAARPVRGPVSMVAASYYAALTAAGELYRSDAGGDSVIDVECGLIAATRFNLGNRQKQALYDAGAAAADRFLARAATGSRDRARLMVVPEAAVADPSPVDPAQRKLPVDGGSRRPDPE